MHDVQGQFAACLRPPAPSAQTRVTFYFSLRRDGREFGRLRTAVRPGSKTDDLVDQLRRQFAACLPLTLAPDLAATIPGKVYFLQLSIAPSGATDVLLRPYGSDIPLPADRYGR